MSIHSTASHLNTYVPGSVRGAALRVVKFEEERPMCKLDISLNCNKCSMRDQYSNATREGVNSSTRKAWAGAPQEAVGAEPRKAIWSYSCSTRPGMEWSNTTVVPGWVTSLMEPELGAWFFIFLFIHLCIYIVWPCGSLFHSVVDLSSNTA